MLELILIRGLPGSGKSTLAKKFEPKFRHLETDMYFVTPDGDYCFQPELLKEAHEWCQYETEMSLFHGTSVVVSNTFTQHWEMHPYKEMARKHGARLTVIVTTGKYQNVHGVPEVVIDRMRYRWQD